MKRTIAFSLITLCWAATAFAKEDMCKDPQDQSTMNICSGKEYEQEDAKLNKTYQRLLPLIAPEEKEPLKKLQLAWIRFRDLECKFESDQYSGGTMEPLVYATCMSRVTRQRTKDLEDQIKEHSF